MYSQPHFKVHQGGYPCNSCGRYEGLNTVLNNGRWARADLRGQMGRVRHAMVDMQQWMGKGRRARTDGQGQMEQGQIGKGRWARAEWQGYLQPLVIHGLVQSLVVLLLPLLHHVVLLQLHGAPHHYLGSLDLLLHNSPHSTLLPCMPHRCVHLAAYDKPVV